MTKIEDWPMVVAVGASAIPNAVLVTLLGWTPQTKKRRVPQHLGREASRPSTPFFFIFVQTEFKVAHSKPRTSCPESDI